MSKAISNLDFEDSLSLNIDTQENDQLVSGNSGQQDSSHHYKYAPKQLTIHQKKSKSKSNKSKSRESQSRKESKLKQVSATTNTTTGASNKSTETTKDSSSESENEDTIRSKEAKKDKVPKSKERNEPPKRKEFKSNTSTSAPTEPVSYISTSHKSTSSALTKPVSTKSTSDKSTSSTSTKPVSNKSTSDKFLEIKSVSATLVISKPTTTISTTKSAPTSASSSSSSKSINQSKRQSVKRVIGITGFPEDEVEAIENEILNVLCCDVSEDMYECDILVMCDPYKRTLKLLEIISIGKAAVVNRIWLKKSISKKQLLPTDDYLVREHKGIGRSISATSNNTHKLFQDLSFVIIGKSTGISNNDQIQLIKNLGGEIVNFNAITKRKESNSNSKVDFIIANDGANDQDVFLSGDKLVSLEWLIESILKFKVQDKSKYRYDNYKNIKKRQHPNFNNNISNNNNNNSNNNKKLKI